MGKAEVLSNIGAGQYTVRLLYSRTRLDAEIAKIDATIANLELLIASMEDGQDKEIRKLFVASYEKRKSFLQDNMPADPVHTVWCADLSDQIEAGTVIGTIEVPGEVGTALVRPGYEGAAEYDSDRDGQLFPAIAQTATGAYVNWALLPHWQKFMPTHRFGEITSIDYVSGTAIVSVEPASSSARGIDINTVSELSYVTFQYMSCDAAAFEIGDHILIEFEGQTWNAPKVIGFKDHPKMCGFIFDLTRGDGTKLTPDLNPVFSVKDSTETSVTCSWHYDSENQRWEIRLDEPFVLDQNGYFVSYNCDDGVATQYPSRYKTADKLQPTDLIPFGVYEDEIVYFKVEETKFDIYAFPLVSWPPDPTWCTTAGGLPKRGLMDYLPFGRPYTFLSTLLPMSYPISDQYKVYSSVPYRLRAMAVVPHFKLDELRSLFGGYEWSRTRVDLGSSDCTVCLSYESGI